MTIRLTVDRERWWAHVTDVADSIDGLIPVVKGNGYGFGRRELALAAARLSPVIAVGTVHELDGLPDGCTPVVLTPTLQHPASTDVVLTVASQHHIDVLAGWAGRVVVKLESSMHRFGGGIELVERAQTGGLRTVGVAIHPPLAGAESEHVLDITRRLPTIDPSLDVWVSHLSPGAFAGLPSTHRYKLRSGTYLWLGDREALRLGADVIQVRRVAAGTRAGYRLIEIDDDGTIVMIGAGSANGVGLLTGDISPFHFQRQRMTCVEPPHMHTSMVFVPDGQPCPGVGEWVDLQRPLTTTTIDELVWT